MAASGETLLTAWAAGEARRTPPPAREGGSLRHAQLQDAALTAEALRRAVDGAVRRGARGALACGEVMPT